MSTTTKRRTKFDGLKIGDLVLIAPKNDGPAWWIKSVSAIDARRGTFRVGQIGWGAETYTLATGTASGDTHRSNRARMPTETEIAEWSVREEGRRLAAEIKSVRFSALTISQLRRIKAILDESEHKSNG